MKLGYEARTGEPVDVPITHCVISALTGGGKTEAILRLMHEAEAAAYTVLALDVKAKPRDFEGVGHEIRPYISESTEPLLVLRMLEAVAGASLFSRFSVILDACMDTRRLEGVHHNLEAIRDNKKAWARRREDAKVLAYLLEKLLEQVREGTYALDVRLAKGRINIMDISSLPLGVQQLVVDSVFRWLLAHERKLVLVLEEAINFIPSMEKVQFETSARKFIREGRSAELWLFASGQALTEMDIHIRKQMRAWVLGPQMEENEAAKFMRQVPMKGVKPEEIQKLPTGHFIAAIRRSEEEGGQVDVKRLYTQPVWLPDDVAVKIAKGQATLKDAMRFKHRPERTVVRDMDAEERKKYESEIRELGARLEELEAETKKHLERIDELSKRAAETESRNKELEAALAAARADRSVVHSGALGRTPKTLHPEIPSAAGAEGDIDPVSLAREVAAILASAEYRLNLTVGLPELSIKEHVVEVEASDHDNVGRLGLLVAEGFLDSRRTIPDLQKEFRTRGWGTWSGGAGKNNMTNLCTKLASMGFVRIDGDAVALVPGVKDRIKRVQA